MSVLSDIDIRRNLGRQVVIHPINDENITPVGYDLRIGLAVNLSDNATPTIVNKRIVIPPMSSTFVISNEHIWISNGIVGTLHSRGSLSARGLVINSTTVDPNWSGQLTFLVFNSSNVPLELDEDAAFVTLMLHRVSTPTANRAKTNPISVASKYGERFGSAFQQKLIDHITSPDSEEIKRIFEGVVRKATNPSLIDTFVFTLKNRTVAGGSMLSRAADFAVKILLLAGLFGIPVLLLLWKTLEPIISNTTGMTAISLNAEALAAFLAAWVALLVSWRAIMKRD